MNGSLPRIVHVPMALSTQGSTLMTVTQRLGEAYAAIGGDTLAILSDNRDLVTPGIKPVYVDFTEHCPREWFTRPELAVDVVAGKLGMQRPFFGRMYDPAIRALEGEQADLVLLYEGHYASATLPAWRNIRERSEVCLYVHNPLSRSYGPGELRRLLGSADRVIFCADHLRRSVERRLGKRPLSNLETVHNGIDSRFQARFPRSATTDEFGILFFGRVVPNKGVHLVLRAATEAAKRTRRPLRVRIVGSAEYSAARELSAYEKKLRAEAATMDLPVDFIPFLPPEELLEVMQQSSVACLPSTWAEGFPLVALEAMATGLPVICSDSPGMVEACGEAAIIAPMGEVAGLSRGIADLAEEETLFTEMSGRGLSRASRFTWDRTVREIARAPIDRASKS